MAGVNLPHDVLGPTGAQGPQGVDGPTGPTGPAGPTGAAGPEVQPLDTTDSPEFTGLTLSNPGTGAGTALVRDGGGVVLDLTSSIAFKENIRELGDTGLDAHDIVMRLKPVSYNYKDQCEIEDVTFGFLAEDVVDVCEDLVIFKAGKPYSLAYHEFIPLLVDVAQQHSRGLQAIGNALGRVRQELELEREHTMDVARSLARLKAEAEGHHNLEDGAIHRLEKQLQVAIHTNQISRTAFSKDIAELKTSRARYVTTVLVMGLANAAFAAWCGGLFR